MILGNWQNIKLICGNHGEDYSHEMIIHQGREGMSTFYSCPCYQSLLQKEITNKSCNNRLNIVDYEKCWIQFLTKCWMTMEISRTLEDLHGREKGWILRCWMITRAY